MNAEEEKERRDGDDCGIILSSSYSFLPERCCASPKAALLSFSLWGKTTREFFVCVCFGCFLFWCKISVLDPPDKSDGRFSLPLFFLILLRERSA